MVGIEVFELRVGSFAAQSQPPSWLTPAVGIAATLAALLALLVMSLSRRARAGDFEALKEQNRALMQIQASDLRLNKITFEIARSIRATSDTQQALDVLCSGLGEGLGVDRVFANVYQAEDTDRLRAQWHIAGLAPLGDFSDQLFSQLAELAEGLFLTTGFRGREDLLVAEVDSDAGAQERGLAFRRETGARAVIMAPIGLGDRVIGIIYVTTVHPRAWTRSETTVVQQVAGFVARAVVEAGHQAQQSEYVERIVGLDRQKSDFLATVSHELRTPLTSISGYLELLQDRDAGELTVEQARMLEVIDRNTTRLIGLIEDLLVLNRSDSGDFKGDAAPVSLHDAITHAGIELSPVALRSSVELDIDAGPEAAIVVGHQGSLDRAIINIVSNAIKFSPAGAVVTIRCTLDQRHSRIVFSCQDRGIGIPARDQRNLFTRFYRASNATAQAIPGTGLGLSIVKQIVEDHGGELRLTSVEGEGTKVVIDLPLSSKGRTQAGPFRDGNDLLPDDVFGIRA